MTSVSRRQVLLGGGALLGAGLVPGVNFIGSAFGDEILRPNYMIRAGTNENPWGSIAGRDPGHQPLAGHVQ